MSCCGQKRRALVSRGSLESTAVLSPPVARGSYVASFAAGAFARLGGRRSSTDIAFRYLGLGLFSLRGVRSGRVYVCESTGATIDADPTDVEALLRTRLFAR